jgi:hypothetical protein
MTFARPSRPVTVVGTVVLAACATATPPERLTLPLTAVRPVAHVNVVMSNEVAIATVVDVLERELGMPVMPVTFHFYPRVSAFEAVLVEAGHDPAFARKAAGSLRAIAGHGHVLLNESRLSESWADRMFTFAHEYTHCLQYALAGGRRSTSDQWLREGFADAVATRVLAALGGPSLETERRRRREELSQTDRTRAPQLAVLLTFTEWIEYRARPELAIDAQAFLAADALIARHGFTAVLSYFAAFATSDDRAGNFRAVFGQDLAAFEAGLRPT